MHKRLEALLVYAFVMMAMLFDFAVTFGLEDEFVYGLHVVVALKIVFLATVCFLISS